MNEKQINQGSSKTEMSAVFIVIFLGLFVWLYTKKKLASKFIIAFFTLLVLFILYFLTLDLLPFLSVFFLSLLFLAIFSTWLWALIDMAIKPESFFTNYPN
jgi:hypothetical protein